jgi:amidohydrolase
LESNEMTQEVCQAIDAVAHLLIGLSTEIHKAPELSFEEHRAVRLICETMSEARFKIEEGIAGLKTAFRATHPAQSPGPTIAFLSEYDALPGVGHACGHNIIAATAVGAALAVGKIKERLPGTLQLIGCPAEERYGGKIIMAEKGVFNGIDVAMMIHPEAKNSGTPRHLTLVPLEISFEGKSSHASAAPEQGINALSSVIQTFNSLNALREHLSSDASIHGIITKGGERTNIVPEFAQCHFSIRSTNIAHRNELEEKVKNCARGAALAMGCKVNFSYFDRVYDPMRVNASLDRAFLKNLSFLGANVTTDVEQARGSTDAANVSQLVPLLHASVAITSEGIKLHTKEFAEAASSETGMQAMIRAAKALSMTAVDVFASENLFNQIREDFLKARENKS